uniref:Protein kinase domain-containing protein n=1 Tax=Polytomella parva TaxID=51329 RepID=A0A7S0UPE4_9CHLO|mmetsp:Transcript_13351/g.23636  ORF Transcript_13351/g.23636 Transcript_13351/m.23636 type:complete len:573 (+) Transcript_13351:111-1829(+)
MSINSDKLLELEAALATAIHVNAVLKQEIEKYVKSLSQAEEEINAWKSRAESLSKLVLEQRKKSWSVAHGDDPWDEDAQVSRRLVDEEADGKRLGAASVQALCDYAAECVSSGRLPDINSPLVNEANPFPPPETSDIMDTTAPPPPLPPPTDEQAAHLSHLIARGRAAGWLVNPKEVVMGPLLGKGAFGSTYRGRWHGATVAVKCVRVSCAKELTSFLREVETLSLIRHPNVVPFLGACLEPPNRFWLLSEYLPGGTLADWLHPSGSGFAGRPPLARRLEMALEIAQGMLALHAADPPILHRDLKPSNVYIDAGGRPRIGDFGLARRMYPETRSMLTGETGTYYYMAPEVIRHEIYDQKADIWSWGVMLCECATGEAPYANEYLTPVQLALAVSGEEMRPRIPTDVDVHVEVVARMSLDFDPYSRPDFDLIVQEMQQALKNVQSRNGVGRGSGSNADSLLARLQRSLTSSWGSSILSRVYSHYPHGVTPLPQPDGTPTESTEVSEAKTAATTVANKEDNNAKLEKEVKGCEEGKNESLQVDQKGQEEPWVSIERKNEAKDSSIEMEEKEELL